MQRAKAEDSDSEDEQSLKHQFKKSKTTYKGVAMVEKMADLFDGDPDTGAVDTQVAAQRPRKDCGPQELRSGRNGKRSMQESC